MITPFVDHFAGQSPCEAYLARRYVGFSRHGHVCDYDEPLVRPLCLTPEPQAAQEAGLRPPRKQESFSTAQTPTDFHNGPVLTAPPMCGSSTEKSLLLKRGTSRSRDPQADVPGHGRPMSPERHPLHSSGFGRTRCRMVRLRRHLDLPTAQHCLSPHTKRRQSRMSSAHLFVTPP